LLVASQILMICNHLLIHTAADRKKVGQVLLSFRKSAWSNSEINIYFNSDIYIVLLILGYHWVKGGHVGKQMHLLQV
jgi:hypothetical protein